MASQPLTDNLRQLYAYRSGTVTSSPKTCSFMGGGANGIRVKFGDFGLSKAADVLKTCCGTLLWAAPEVYLKVADPLGAADDTYGVAVDVWSLGAVIAWLECGLPEYEDEWKTDAVGWIHALQSYVVDKYQAQGNELLWLVIDSMLVEDPDERSSADYVTTEAGKLLQSMAARSDGGGSATPTPSVPGAGYAVGIEGLDGDKCW
ncbi:kinase-like domain-containing protein [Diaporthe sp. PMI_573]|nr:kinase-like domain-containing protein [Diaporthaceae sp. PMI_573]